MIFRMMTCVPTATYGKVAKQLNTRALSTYGVEAVDKLKLALEEYRMTK